MELCGLCGRAFLWGKGHEGNGRYLYCSAECAAIARTASCRKARRTYRESAEGKAQHADEERRRRARQRDSVGDQCEQVAQVEAKVEAMKPAPIACAVAEEEPVEWCVEVTPELAAAARRLRRQRKEMTCVVCGRRGYVVAVVVMRPKAPKRPQGGPRGPLRRRE
jgi:hypothetical protein